jgi:hypothetical protein
MPSIGLDLAAIRKERQISLEEIHAQTRIPMATLKTIEDGSLFENAPEKHKTYIRSFVRSYGKALKLSDEVLVAALDAFEAGRYDHEILENQGITPKSYPLFELDEESEEDGDAGSEVPKAAKKPKKEADKNKKGYVVTPDPPTVESVDWVNMGKKFSEGGVQSRIWVFVTVFLLISVISVVIFIYRNEIFGLETDPEMASLITENEDNQANPTINPINPVIPDSSAADSDEENVGETEATQNTAQSESPVEVPDNRPNQVLGDTLKVLIYAAYDKLEPVRVTTDYTWQTNPYWVEEGEAFEFAFRDTLLVRGQYSRMVLMLNGHPIENFRQRYFDVTYNSVMLTRSIFEDDPTYTRPAPLRFPIEDVPPPSNIVNAATLR